MHASPIRYNGTFDVRISGLHAFVRRQRNRSPRTYFSVKFCIDPNLVNTVIFRKELIKGSLIENPQQYQNASSDTNREPRDVDKRIKSVFAKVPDRNQEVIFEHWTRFKNFNKRYTADLPNGNSRNPSLFLRPGFS